MAPAGTPPASSQVGQEPLGRRYVALAPSDDDCGGFVDQSGNWKRLRGLTDGELLRKAARQQMDARRYGSRVVCEPDCGGTNDPRALHRLSQIWATRERLSRGNRGKVVGDRNVVWIVRRLV